MVTWRPLSSSTAGIPARHCISPELEDVSDLDATCDGQCSLAIRAGVALDHVADVGDLGKCDVAAPVDAEMMFAVDIGAGAEVALTTAAARSTIIGIARPTGPVTRAGTDRGADLVFVCHLQRVWRPVAAFSLDRVQLMITPRSSRATRPGSTPSAATTIRS